MNKLLMTLSVAMLTSDCSNTPAETNADNGENESGDEKTSSTGSASDESTGGEPSTTSGNNGGTSSTSSDASTTSAGTSATSTSTTGQDVTSAGPTTGDGDTTTNTTEGESDSDGVVTRRECDGEPLPMITLTPVIEDLASPTAVEFIPGDPDAVYVSLRGGGFVRIDMNDPDGSRREILNLNSPSTLECGFLSFAFHPEWDGSAEQRLYLSYTPECATMLFGAAESLVSEYIFDGTTATMSRPVIQLEQPANNHNGGFITFGPDGYLYLGFGDGGGSNDQYDHGQNPATPFGAILRLDVDNLETPLPGNLTSADVGGAEVDGRILHWGLRNPWRFSFDRGTHDLYVGDVGQDNWEEIDFIPAGTGPTNFGWPAFEGPVTCPTCGNASLFPNATDVKPIASYEVTQGQSLSVTGGVVYRGSAIPGLVGRYIYGEYQEGWIAALTPDGQGGACDQGELIGRQGVGIVHFGQDLAGEIYVVHLSDGVVYRIDPA